MIQYVGLAGLRRNVPWVYGDDASLLPVSGMLKKMKGPWNVMCGWQLEF